MARALIFDYNQVLADDLAAHTDAYKKAFKKFGVSVSSAELKKLMHKTRNEKISYFKEKHGLKDCDERIFREKDKEFLKIANAKSLLFPGAAEALEKLGKKFSLGLFTGTNLEQMFIPKKTVELFKAIVTIKDYKKPKPDPEGLLLCVKLLGLAAEECAYIGDSAHDMAAAKAAGCKAIGIITGAFSAEELRKAGADMVIANLNELEKTRL